MNRRLAMALAVVFNVALAVRLGYLLHVASEPGFVWDDPDSYMAHGLALAGRGGGDAPDPEGGWRFRFEAVEHDVDGRRYALPPLYPVFLSFFAIFPGYPFTAQVAQAVLGAAAASVLVLLGARLHSLAAGLVAGLAYAVWLPNVIAVWSTMQEALYVPLTLLGFVLLFRTHRDTEGEGGKKSELRNGAASGAVFGLATLTRSMPLYFIPLAGLVLFRRSRRAALALLAGFAAVTVPYSLALSLHLGEPTFVENHGGLRIASRYGGEDAGERPPGTLGTAATLVRAFVAAPEELIHSWLETLRSLLHVNGGRLLQLYLGAETRFGAAVSKLAAHTFGDGLFVGVLLLSPLGLAIAGARKPELAAYLFVWITVTLGLTTLSGFGGARLRAPVEPYLAVLAGCAVSGFRRDLSGHRGWIAGALLVSAALAAVVLPQLPASLRARGEYGVYWPLESPTKRAPMYGEARFNVLAIDDAVVFYVRPRNPAGPTRVDVRLAGEAAQTVLVERQEHRFVYPWPSFELVPVELEARDERTGEPVRLLVVVPRR